VDSLEWTRNSDVNLKNVVNSNPNKEPAKPSTTSTESNSSFNNGLHQLTKKSVKSANYADNSSNLTYPARIDIVPKQNDRNDNVLTSLPHQKDFPQSSFSAESKSIQNCVLESTNLVTNQISVNEIGNIAPLSLDCSIVDVSISVTDGKDKCVDNSKLRPGIDTMSQMQLELPPTQPIVCAVDSSYEVRDNAEHLNNVFNLDVSNTHELPHSSICDASQCTEELEVQPRDVEIPNNQHWQNDLQSITHNSLDTSSRRIEELEVQPLDVELPNKQPCQNDLQKVSQNSLDAPSRRVEELEVQPRDVELPSNQHCQNDLQSISHNSLDASSQRIEELEVQPLDVELPNKQHCQNGLQSISHNSLDASSRLIEELEVQPLDVQNDSESISHNSLDASSRRVEELEVQPLDVELSREQHCQNDLQSITHDSLDASSTSIVFKPSPAETPYQVDDLKSCTTVMVSDVAKKDHFSHNEAVGPPPMSNNDYRDNIMSPAVLHHFSSSIPTVISQQGEENQTVNENVLNSCNVVLAQKKKNMFESGAKHEISTDGLPVHLSLQDTRITQPSVLEAETVASLLDFAKKVVPTTTLIKRPSSDSNNTTLQFKRKR
jgi:hypothetical protein